jgi:PAS domain S-box-containing protein
MKLTGYDVQELIESELIRFVHGDDRALIKKDFINGIIKRKDYTRGLQFRLVKKSGDVMWVELNSHRRFDGNGEFLQQDAILRDITERKRAEEERAVLAKRLEERTSELSAANSELSRAVRAKDEFLASMSHELRTPLSSILSISESLEEEVYGPVSERQQKAVRNVTESGQHLLSLINDILDLSKIEAGRISLEMAPVNVEELCQASMRLARSQAFKKRLSVSLTVDSQVTKVRADERYLKQILVNLLGNAVKFTPEGGTMGLEVKGDADEQMVSFTVWDKGIGIPPEKHSLLFKPFTQLDSSLSRQYGGTGLGLALVSRLTEMHGGSVTLESGLGEGSRFTVTLPWNPDLSGPDEETGGDMLTGGPADEAAFNIRRALVVEDSQGDADQIARYLSEAGISHTVEKEGGKAVRRAIELKPDIIILDIMLPDMEGWEVLKALKGGVETQSIPVIMASVIDERRTGRDMGADDYIVKPVTREQLKRVLSNVLKERETGAASKAEASRRETVASGQGPGGPLIVLADDNETTISIVSEYLYAHGFRIIAARNGREACDRIRESHPDLVLMDIQMPGVDGLEATGIIRGDSDRAVAAVPIIALTALAMVGDRERCLQAGADEYMSKPVSLKKLLKTIEHMMLMNRQRQRGGA